MTCFATKNHVTHNGFQKWYAQDPCDWYIYLLVYLINIRENEKMWFQCEFSGFFRRMSKYGLVWDYIFERVALDFGAFFSWTLDRALFGRHKSIKSACFYEHLIGAHAGREIRRKSVITWHLSLFLLSIWWQRTCARDLQTQMPHMLMHWWWSSITGMFDAFERQKPERGSQVYTVSDSHVPSTLQNWRLIRDYWLSLTFPKQAHCLILKRV